MKYFIASIYICLSISATAQSQIENKKELSYNSQGFVYSEKTTESNGDVITQYFRYPKDVIATVCLANPTTPVAASLKKLIDLNIIDKPIETYTTLVRNGVQSVIAAEHYTYYEDKPYVKIIRRLKKKIPYASFVGYSVDNGCIEHISPDYEVDEVVDAYDDYGNVLQVTSKFRFIKSFIYNYRGAYNVAEVNNASNAEIAYSSFESDNQGFWSYSQNGCVSVGGIAVTGDKVYDMSVGSITRSNLPVQKYIVSLWFNGSQPTVSGAVATKIIPPTNANPFSYAEYTVDNVSAITISGGDAIDELRLYPFNAEMTTTTYKPLVGISSKADKRNDITYYEYDELGRLSMIRDRNKNIIKKLEHKTIKPD